MDRITQLELRCALSHQTTLETVRQNFLERLPAGIEPGENTIDDAKLRDPVGCFVVPAAAQPDHAATSLPAKTPHSPPKVERRALRMEISRWKAERMAVMVKDGAWARCYWDIARMWLRFQTALRPAARLALQQTLAQPPL